MPDSLVSICIPTYNGEKYLRECLDSCINQTFGSYEIVICDDGSTDTTVRIIEEYMNKSPVIRFFKNERNLGLVENWNKCLTMAKGEWIKFVFQDDYISADCLKEFTDRIEPSAVLMVCERNFILPDHPSEDVVNYYTKGVRTLRNTTAYEGNYYSPVQVSVIAIENMCMNIIGEPSLTFFKKNIVNELGYFNRVLKQICDLEFFLRIAGKYGLTYIPKKLCAFRIHEHSTTSSNLESRFFELKYIEPLLFSYFLLFGKEHQDFRRHLNFFQLLKLKIYFRVKTYQASLINQKEKRGHYLFGDTQHVFKEITPHQKGSFLIKLIALLRK